MKRNKTKSEVYSNFGFDQKAKIMDQKLTNEMATGFNASTFGIAHSDSEEKDSLDAFCIFTVQIKGSYIQDVIYLNPEPLNHRVIGLFFSKQVGEESKNW